MSDQPDERALLRQKLESLESLRDVLGDEAVEEAKAALEARLRAVETGGGAVVAGDVQVAGGDFIGRDKVTVTINGKRAVIVGGDARGLIAVTGDENRITISPEQVSARVLEAAYLRSLASDCQRLPLGVVDPGFLPTGPGKPPLSLSEIYVDLDVLAAP
ncbi:MAG TPA: hypothetical protein ENK56_04110, partial [Chloroflexi bacterium]|nr:hypothetical protein [Chloroflexota bacterium]